MPQVTFDVSFRNHQLTAWQRDTRFVVRVWHRRAGKTWYTLVAQILRCLEPARDDWRAYYIAPTFKQAKAISWDYVKQFLKGVPGCVFNEQDLRVDFPNGARLQLLGAEQYDSLRGRYADDIAVDETAMVPTVAWTQVLNPMLSDRKGRATFIGTPMGRRNLLFDLYEYARKGDDSEWSCDLLTYKDTNVLDPHEIERMRRLMRPEEFAQEMECSFDAAIRGAYYLHEMQQMEDSGRITTVKYDDKLPVQVAVDLGWSDATACTFWQQHGTEHRCIKAQEFVQTPLPDIVNAWHKLPFPVQQVILPHDAEVHELSTGTTRREVFEQLGCSTVIAPKLPIHEGIEQVRMLLRHTWMDDDDTRQLQEALRSYHSEFDEVKNVHSTRPVHNWACHLADSARYYATGHVDLRNALGKSLFGPRPRHRLGVYA